MERAVGSAYAACRRMQRRHDPTFYVATRALPGTIRPAIHALYGFVRGADQLVDGPRRPSDPHARRLALDAWEDALRRGVELGASPHPVIAALVDAGARHELPLSELGPYMRSMRVDCDRVRIEDRSELERYMEGIAGGVGRIMAALLGAPPERREDFVHLGLGFQLTNLIRDVREDYRLDRVYLPRRERARLGVGEAELAAGVATPGFRELVAREVARARELFAGGEAAVDAVAPRLRPSMRLARGIYLRVLDRVEALGFDVLARRADMRPWTLVGPPRGMLGG